MVLESTTYPGTTDEDLREVIEKNSGLKAGIDFHLAFSPEREDPGNPEQRGRDDSKDCRRTNAGLPEEGHRSLFDGDQNVSAGIILSRRRGGQAAGEYLPQREHRIG